MTRITTQLLAVRQRIAAAEVRFERVPGSVQLLAVSKGHPPPALREACSAGQRCFGESYVQEALGKINALTDCAPEWHFIGPLQRNKTRAVAAHFAWVQSLDRLALAERLSAQRPTDLPALQVCIEVNISGEASKSGVTPAEVPALAAALAALPRLRLRGLMALPAPVTEFAAQLATFQRLQALYEELRTRGYALDTLSMGMSDDLEAAIAAGATLVRVGTAIFGERM
ncbi:MAG: alanine racemase domain protein [Proteobacteria bacterium]|nr:alanine racemase domain protein [Pseudomonadota bacterium]